MISSYVASNQTCLIVFQFFLFLLSILPLQLSFISNLCTLSWQALSCELWSSFLLLLWASCFAFLSSCWPILHVTWLKITSATLWTSCSWFLCFVAFPVFLFGHAAISPSCCDVCSFFSCCPIQTFGDCVPAFSRLLLLAFGPGSRGDRAWPRWSAFVEAGFRGPCVSPMLHVISATLELAWRGRDLLPFALHVLV